VQAGDATTHFRAWWPRRRRGWVERIRSGTTTLAEVSRELEIAPAVLCNWMRLVERGGKTAVEVKTP
jgi:transposase-like protein